MSFDTIVMVDWSGGNDRGASPKKDAIWIGVQAQDLQTHYMRNRQVAEAFLAQLFAGELAAGRRVLVGFDFPFGYPSGFGQALRGDADPLTLWDWFAQHLQDAPGGNNRFALAAQINRRFPGVGPFWFNGGKEDLADLPRKGRLRHGFGMAEKRLCEKAARGAFSCWQMGGAGAVGSQVMTGMAVLSRLRAQFAGQISVWPFENLAQPIVFAEIWPSLYADEVKAAMQAGDIKDEVQVRHLAKRFAQVQRAGAMAAMFAAAPPEARIEEGWILGLETEKSAADLIPPRLQNDCFAMPQGVEWVPVEAALARLQAALTPVTGAEPIPLAQGLGRILARDALALRSNPPQPNSAVDGYGFAHAATGAGLCRLPLVEGRSAAGQPFTGQVAPGHAIRILTGAVLPAGVDTVVMQEDCAVGADSIAFDGPIKPRANTRRAGEDVEAGALALPAGQCLRAPDLALLAALGLSELLVHRQLRVGVLSTGDEIVTRDAAPHQIYDANRPMLLALATGWGYRAVDLGHVRDDIGLIRDRLNEATAQVDVILTSGGASAGDEDHVSRLLQAEGKLTSWRIALKPGRPLALALWGGVPVIGLPGNPVAALVCALIFGRPALSALAGGAWLQPQGFDIAAAFSKRKKAGRREYLRARVDADGRAEIFASEGSGRISGLSWATGLVELPDQAAEIAPGDPVRFLPYGSFGL